MTPYNSVWQFSSWSLTEVTLFIFLTIFLMWAFPAVTFFLFRFLIRRGEPRGADEIPKDHEAQNPKGSQLYQKSS